MHGIINFVVRITKKESILKRGQFCFQKTAFCRPCREKLSPSFELPSFSPSYSPPNASSPSSSCSLHSDTHPQRLVLQIYKPLLNISKGHFNPCLFLWRVAAKWAVVVRRQGIFRTPGCQNKISPTHSRALGPRLARLPPPRRDHSTTQLQHSHDHRGNPSRVSRPPPPAWWRGTHTEIRRLEHYQHGRITKRIILPVAVAPPPL